MKNNIKILIILCSFMAVLCAYFWMTSRYPELSAKAVLGEQAFLSSLGFVPLIKITDEFSLWERIFAETVNWLDTNKKGMSFAFLIGAFFLSILPLIPRKRFKSGVLNSVLGMVMGAPLGICVNCAAPVARSLHAAGTSVQTSLAALIASPTLNIVVLTMAFGMLASHLVWIKLALTFIFILVIIPFACRYLFHKEVQAQDEMEMCPVDLGVSEGGTLSWGVAFKQAIILYAQNLFYLLKIALPLMILSGFLGSVFTAFMPWSMVSGVQSDLSVSIVFALLIGLSIFGALLPSPMAFDVVVAGALLQAGVPVQYVAVFLVTLGSFSIYAFFIVWQAMSLRIAAFLFGVTVVFGVFSGYVALWFDAQNMRRVHDGFSAHQAPVEGKDWAKDSQALAHEGNQFDPIITRSDDAFSRDHIMDMQSRSKALTFSDVLDVTHPPHLKIEAADFLPRNLQDNGQAFSYIHGEALGVKQPYSVSYLSAHSNYIPLSTMSVATGDVHSDGWVDLLVMGDHEVRPNLILYSNINGQRFERQVVPVPEGVAEVLLVALFDLNGDGWLDIVFSTADRQTFVIYNQEGAFVADNIAPLTDPMPGMTVSMAFGDVERDGDLDVFLGNWNVGTLHLNFSESQNRMMFYDDAQGYMPYDMPEITGETLVSLFSDFNGDGLPDLYVGNDYDRGSYSDVLFLGTGDKEGGFDNRFRLMKKRDIKGMRGIQSTMSIDVGDIDNDLKPDYYMAQIAYIGQHIPEMSKITEKQISYAEFCQTPQAQGMPSCESEMLLRHSFAEGSHFITDACDDITDKVDHAKCVRHLVVHRYKCDLDKLEEERPGFLSQVSRRYLDYCRIVMRARAEGGRPFRERKYLWAEDGSIGNVLLHNKSSERVGARFLDEGYHRKAAYGAWTWNARFADLDNDGWQDIYMVNGFPYPMAMGTNIYYRNDGRGHFLDETKQAGLESYSATSAFSYADFDNDGDLDIFTVPTDGAVEFYMNNAAQNAVQFELADKMVHNSHAIGAKIIIRYRNADGAELQQIGEMRGSGGFRSYNQPLIHFGLGDVAQISGIDVIWPDGDIDIFEGTFSADKRYRVTRHP